MTSGKPKPARLSVLGNHLRVAASVLIPLIFTFLLILPNFYAPQGTSNSLFGYQLGWVYAFFVTGLFWMSNVFPIPVTGLVPLVILPLVGISTSKKLADAFMTNVNMTTFGSLIFVLAIDVTGLRERLSLRILKHSSGSFRWIFIYTFVITALLAMWINAAAATFLMIKVVEGFLDEMKSQVTSGALGEERMLRLQELSRKSPVEKQNDANVSVEKDEEKRKPEEASTFLQADGEQSGERTSDSINVEGNEAIEKSTQDSPEDAAKTFEMQNDKLVQDFGGELLYAVAVAANLSGTLWPYCSPMGAELLNNRVAISFKTKLVFGWTQASWMTYSFPLILINTTIALAFLLWANFTKTEAVKRIFKNSGERLCSNEVEPATLRKVLLGTIFSAKHAELPPFRFAELAVLFLSGLMIILYLTRLPVFMTGWIELLYNRIDLTSPKDDRLGVGDAMGMIIIVFLSFIIPGIGCKIFSGPTSAADKPKSAGLIGWKSVQTRFPWGIVMLIGGSSCLGTFSEKSVAAPIADNIFRSVGNGLTGALQVQFILIALTVRLSPFTNFNHSSCQFDSVNPKVGDHIIYENETQIFGSHVMSNSGTCILMLTVWKKLLGNFIAARRVEMQGALILPVFSMASLCFIIPSSSIPTALVYLNNKHEKLSAMYFLRMGLPLFLITSVPTIFYALLNRPASLIVTEQ
ncbi:unnamed protein product [Orchesella dallaii]|uniref:Citrate transporter-like domain-containing protein n=1 Tax=Orchesella dallaii TaxID=48710 RepID=A0ABP1QC98_9HEXA